MIETNENKTEVWYSDVDETWYNQAGEPLDLHKSTKEDGTEYSFFTNEAYWDCDCDEDYIHERAKKKYCVECNTLSFDRPDSREGEIDEIK